MAEANLQATTSTAMVEANPPGTITLPPSLQGVMAMPASKQMGLVFSLAAVVAIALYIFFWSQTPNFTPLYASLDNKDAVDVTAALQASNIPYEIDTATGVVLVGKDKLHEARMKLAAQGLPKSSSGRGMEQLSEEQGFGTSQFVESARYHHAMEAELARTISSLRNVRSARVHLALPKQSLFVRDRIAPSASVVVDLISGAGINNNHVTSIINLVSSSVPNLSADQVTVVDQNGRLLSEGRGDEGVVLTAKQYNYSRQLEEDYARRVEALLTPIVGIGKVRAEVSAEVDFDQIESTSENYDPVKRTIRSEQTTENRQFGNAEPSGIPGALSNQPPGETALTENTDIDNPGNAESANINSSRNAVRNYEVDRTISHTRRHTGVVKRLTVAVLIDDIMQAVLDANGQPTEEMKRQSWSNEQLQRMSTLVREAIGFNEVRGDRVNVINAPFTPPEELEAVEVPIYEEGWFWTVVKQALGGLLVMYLVFGVLKPSLKNLSNYRPPELIAATEREEGGLEGQVEREEIGEDGEPIPLPSDQDKKVEFAQAMVEHDPRRVAKVVKEWVANG